MFNWLQQRLETRRDARRTQQQARKIYEAIVAQARQPEFYRSMGISDTVPGRFEMVTLHMYLILERLQQLEPDGELLAQSLVDVMFDDMDDVAREIGVGDMAVAPKIKKLARSFRSRLEAYERAMARSDDTPEVRDEPDPIDAVCRILFSEDQGKRPAAASFVAYIERERRGLAKHSCEELIETAPLFGAPEGRVEP